MSSDPDTLLTEREYLAIERCVTQEGGRTLVYTGAHKCDDILKIEVIGCDLRLEEAYAEV